MEFTRDVVHTRLVATGDWIVIMYPHIMNIKVKLCNTITLQCSTMCVKESLILLLTGQQKWTLLGHLFSRSIGLVLSLFCCQFIIMAQCKTDLKYSHPDISWFLFFFPLVARQGQERLLQCLVSLLCCNGSKLNYDLKLRFYCPTTYENEMTQ